MVTCWGGLLRYAVAHRAWLPPLQAAPGWRSLAVGHRNHPLFAWNCFQGYSNAMNLDTGTHCHDVPANAVGRSINLDPVRRHAIVHARGHGLHQFDDGASAAAAGRPPS